MHRPQDNRKRNTCSHRQEDTASDRGGFGDRPFFDDGGSTGCVSVTGLDGVHSVAGWLGFRAGVTSLARRCCLFFSFSVVRFCSGSGLTSGVVVRLRLVFGVFVCRRREEFGSLLQTWVASFARGVPTIYSAKLNSCFIRNNCASPVPGSFVSRFSAGAFASTCEARVFDGDRVVFATVFYESPSPVYCFPFYTHVNASSSPVFVVLFDGCSTAHFKATFTTTSFTFVHVNGCEHPVSSSTARPLAGRDKTDVRSLPSRQWRQRETPLTSSERERLYSALCWRLSACISSRRSLR